jgi:VWFA-related protein
MIRILLAAMLAAAPLAAATKIAVTVVEQKSGAPVTNLEAKDFAVFDDKTARTVEDAAYSTETLDLMLLLDTSLAGGAVQPMAQDFVAQLQPREQMAVVAFHSSADLIQDFTSSRTLILRAISRVKYGNQPHVLDALYAAIDGGFQPTGFRRAILLLTSGVEGDSRMAEKDVIRMARRNQVSIYPVYVSGYERGMFELLAKQTGGASFNLRDMKKAGQTAPGKRVFEAARGRYIVTVGGNLGLGEKLRVEVKRPDKLQVSAMSLE